MGAGRPAPPGGRRRRADEPWAAVWLTAAAGARRTGAARSRALAREVARPAPAGLGQQRAAAAEAERLRGRLERRAACWPRSLEADQERAIGRRRPGPDATATRSGPWLRPGRPGRGRCDAGAVAAAGRSCRRTGPPGRHRGGRRKSAQAEAAAQRLADGRGQQHAKLADLESEARHLARVADLLAEFRNTVVASVGPRLAVQAAELFGELTDHEYDELQVDPETYQLQISDAGTVYGLDRFSGSEIDLANLALRVAISEHIHFQSGGSVGLMVLDEVFGPLDEDRKARMLLALERLRGRFRQVLVVTHDAAIKEQLPNAIEVVKLPGRRATARLASG